MPESFLSWVLICGTALVLLYNFLKVRPQNKRRLLIFLPVSLLLFDFRQTESVLFGFADHIYLMIFATVATFTLLELGKKIDGYFALAVFSSIVASFSWLIGLLVWPIGLFQMFLQGGKDRVRAILWSAIGVVAWLI